MIEELVKKILDDTYQMDIMKGDASSRKYYRVKNDCNSYVIVVDGPRSQQVVDYIRMSEVLGNRLRIPKIYSDDRDASFILLEDVGDKHLYDDKKNGNEKLVKKALNDIDRYQSIDKNLKIFSQKKFDDKKLGFELNVANEYFLKRYLNLTELNELEAIDKLIKNVFQKKLVICHRDYHSKNLMIKSDELIHIDFQDSMIGPSLYDTVSFIEDPYFEHKNKEELRKYYFDIDTHYDSYDEYMRDYQIIAYQRILKALGSYAFLNYEKEKEDYLKYIPTAIKTLEELSENIEEKAFEKLVAKIKRGNL